ncbi:MAG: septum formation initiator family protein [Limnohabitans sp.]|jgi:cell division protein FtsB
MGSRFVPFVLVTLLVILNAQLWFGRGSLPSVAKLERELEQQRASNEEARRANERLNAEVNDLKEGLNMVEERARMELGMVKANEIFVQIAK